MGFFVFMIGLAIYLIPAIVADSRKHPNRIPIFVINLFLGWTVLGWVIALAWSFSNIERGERR